MTKQHANADAKSKIDAIISSSKRIGLLINERFVNLPVKIADPLLTSLQTELNRMAKRDPSYDFEYYVIICKLYKPKSQKGRICYNNLTKFNSLL